MRLSPESLKAHNTQLEKRDKPRLNKHQDLVNMNLLKKKDLESPLEKE